MQQTRRDFVKYVLSGAAGLSLCSLTGSRALAQTASTSSIIQHVKTLLSKRNDITALRLLYPQGSLANVEPLVKSFQQHTGLNISLQSAGVDSIDTRMLLHALDADAGYDIALPATYALPDLVEANALYVLEEFAQRYETRFHFAPSIYPHGDRYKNKLYGYQTDGDVYLTFYNRQLMQRPETVQEYQQRFGEPFRIPETWEALDQMMQFIHAPDEDIYGGCLFRVPSFMVWEWWIRFHALGGLPFDDNMQTMIASDAGVKALSDMIAASAWQHPSSTSNKLFENWKIYAQGRCFANLGWGGSQKFFNQTESAVQGKLLHSPTPGVSYFNWGWNYVVAKQCRYAEIAYLFCLYATQPDVSTHAIQEDGFFDPFHKTHYQQFDIKNIYSPAFLKAHYLGMRYAIPDFYMQGRGFYITALRDAITAAQRDELTPKEALRYAAREWDTITNEIGRDSQAEQWQYLKRHYPKNWNTAL